MRKKHLLFIIMGRSGCGKTTIVKEVCRQTEKKVVQSYTTRNMRNNEKLMKKEDLDHIHISKTDRWKYDNDMVAYVDRIGYCSFATRKQMIENDFYIVNPNAILNLQHDLENDEIQLIKVYIKTDKEKCRHRAKERSKNKIDYKIWKSNFEAEDKEFTECENNENYDFLVDNNDSQESAVEQIKKVMIHCYNTYR